MPRVVPISLLLALAAALTGPALASTYHLETPGHPETFEAARRATFDPAPGGDLKVDYTSAGLWARVELSPAGEGRDWYLRLDDTTFNTVELYLVDGQGQLVKTARSGSFVPLRERDVPRRDYAFRLDLPRGETRVAYLRFTSYNILDPSMRLYSAEELAASDASEGMLLGGYYGAALALLLFNLLLFVSIRDRATLCYAGFIACTAFTFFTFDGLSDEFLGGLVSGWQHYTTFIGTVALAAAAVFARIFLSLPRIAPRFAVALAALAVLDVAAAVFSLTPWKVASGYSADFLLVVNGLMVLAAGWLALRAGFRPARFYLLSWAALFSMAIVWLGMMYGFLPRNPFTEHGILAGAVLEMILVSLGLGDRLKTFAAEREHATRLAREGQAVAQAARMLAHDLKKPYSLLDALLTLISAEDDPRALRALATRHVPEVRQAIDYVRKLLNDLMHVGGPERLDPRPQDLGDLLDRALRQGVGLPPGADVHFDWRLGAARGVLIDEVQGLRLLINLLENAVQAVGPRGNVWVRTRRHHGRLTVSIGNDGPLIAPSDLAQLFKTFFTKGKRGGTGLGLAVCRKIVEDHGGKIWCTSAPVSGTEFHFTIDSAPLQGGPGGNALAGSGAEPQKKATTENGNRPLFAVVDDCPFVRESWSHVKDADIISFEDPTQLLQKMLNDKVFRKQLQLVITDFDFGEKSPLDGGELARQLASFCDKPVILSSDHPAPAGSLGPFASRIAKRPHSLAELAQLLTWP